MAEMSSQANPNPEELDPDWSKYPDTILRFAGGLSIDLRKPLPREAIDALGSMGLGRPFAVMTAHDPNGQDLPAVENQRRAAQLESELESEGCAFVRVEACSPDGSHCESSLAITTEREAAEALARRFSQVAIFWFDGGIFWIVGGVVAGDAVMLPRPF